MLPSCETIFVFGHGETAVPAYPLSTRTDAVTFRVECPWSEIEMEEGEPRPRCSGAYRLREASERRRLVGAGSFPRGRWKARKVVVRLTPTGRRLAARSEGVLVVVSLGGQNVDGVRWRIRLRV